MPYGGVGTILELARDVGPMAKLDNELGVLERPHPYTDADQVMNIARTRATRTHLVQGAPARQPRK